jgi:hypothetical protein
MTYQVTGKGDFMSTLTKEHTCVCGSRRFLVTEHMTWKATTDTPDGRLDAYRVTDNGIDEITCAECETVYDQSAFADIDFN